MYGMTNANKPHARGDEPLNEIEYTPLAYINPTHVGMNRDVPVASNVEEYKPHARGDEPKTWTLHPFLFL